MKPLLASIALFTSLIGASPSLAEGPAAVTLGIDVLLDVRSDLDLVRLKDKRVGLITNASGVDGRLMTTADRLHADPRVNLTQLYAPEHGLRGVLKAGEKVKDSIDPVTGVPVEALFGKRRQPTAKSLKRIDILLFDIQDIGSRTYTYVSTLGETMKAAAKAGITYVVLDRPNPLGGLIFEGPIREERRKSFIGWGPLPVSHGMTVGELAQFYNTAMGIGCDLHVVKMRGWSRTMTWGDTGLTWVATSPGIPTPEAAALYIATGMIGGVTTNINEGVGTTLPFSLIGADFIDADALAATLTKAKLPGVRVRATTYRPYYHRHRKQVLAGVQLHVTDRSTFRPLRTALTVLTTLETMYPGKTLFRKAGYVARVWGNTNVIPAIQAGASVADLEASWRDDQDAFTVERTKALLYR
ncbi:MAG: hypothetical protein ACI9MR_004688 [Myxococcota bacterium]|jgi:uncharacterized protein YbbC (DUF1343 family)